jgi:hypothetical protein
LQCLLHSNSDRAPQPIVSHVCWYPILGQNGLS